MKYLLVTLAAIAAIYGSQFIGTRVSGVAACCALAGIFVLLCFAAVAACLLNRDGEEEDEPAEPTTDHLIGYDPAPGKSQSISAAFRLEHGQTKGVWLQGNGAMGKSQTVSALMGTRYHGSPSSSDH